MFHPQLKVFIFSLLFEGMTFTCQLDTKPGLGAILRGLVCDSLLNKTYSSSQRNNLALLIWISSALVVVCYSLLLTVCTVSQLILVLHYMLCYKWTCFS